jgi:hypothetical protein
MKLLIAVLLFFLSSTGFCQFTERSNLYPIGTPVFPYLLDMKFSSENHGTILASKGSGGTFDPTITIVLTTHNGGLTWDTTEIMNKTFLSYNLEQPSDSIIYFSSLWSYFPIGLPSYQQRGINRSFDGGQTWDYVIIDSLAGQNKENNIEFLNDSVGVFYSQAGVYLTTDYGTTWDLVSNIFATNLGHIDDKFVLIRNQIKHEVDPITFGVDTTYYPQFCQGNTKWSTYSNGLFARSNLASDGIQLGYPYGNYASLNLDFIPLDTQKVVHFPENGFIYCQSQTENSIYLMMYPGLVKTSDNGDSFHALDLPNGCVPWLISFANDSVGYILGVENNESVKVWKTTNGGGPNGVQLVTNTFTAGLDEKHLTAQVQIFPNPSSAIFKIESEKRIDRIEVYTVLGQKCHEQLVNSMGLQLNLADFENGTYFVTVYSDQGKVTKKISLL